MDAGGKAIKTRKQVVSGAPRRCLAFQHFETFKRRFQPFPVRVEMFSRFRSPKEIKAGLVDLAEGKIDIAIGTHRLLSEDIVVRDLGLVLVDEEQRFGVKHKERLKQMKKAVDVISMSATPIPRTLHMSLLGLRDMSVIETPPKDRLAIHTVVAPYQPELIRQALELELGRGGQVYFLHNRVDSIWMRAASLQELVPGRESGSGRADGKRNWKTMLQFMRHESIFWLYYNYRKWARYPARQYDGHRKCGTLRAFLATNCADGRPVECRGVRIPLVAAGYGAYGDARKRLAALKEFSDRGRFKIAALGLELRAPAICRWRTARAHDSVGFDTYVRLLEETVRELKARRWCRRSTRRSI